MRTPHLLFAFAALLPALGHAGPTRTFKVTNYKDLDEGEATGVVVSSLGEAHSGYGSTRVEIGEAVAYSSLAAPDGSVYVGTGDQGAIYRLKKGRAERIAKLDAVLVSALALGRDGTLYAGTMPGGKVFALDTRDAKAKPRELAKLDAEHVWALSLDEGTQTLTAGTGPQGKLVAIDLRSGKARVVADTEEKHVLSLERGEGGVLYAGTSDQAILFRAVPGGKLEALHDFEGDEVRAIARHGGTLYVAVNEFQKSSGSPSTPTGPRGTKIVLPSSPSTSPTPSTTPARDRKGKGAIYRVDADGRVEQLHALADGYFTALHVDDAGNVWAASGANGRVYLIRGDRTVFTALDLPERQVLTLAFGGPERVLGTGDAGALYRIADAPPKDASYLTKVFDAGFVSRWGNLRWTGQGALTVQTRAGNTSKPDKTWSAWQAPAKVDRVGPQAVGLVASPPARYLQVRVQFGAARTSLKDVTVYYQPQNQRSRVTDIAVGDEGGKRPSAALRGRPRSPVVKLRWRAENPDDDELVYRLYFREENEANWKPLGGPEPLTRSEYEWNTEAIPDGNYVVKVVVSDERANPKEVALEHALISPPFLVDNRKPELSELRIAWPEASGRAHDSFSPISDLAYSIDGGEWLPVAPRDGVCDDQTEDFAFKLPADLPPGAHTLAVRAVDAADNVGAVQSTFRVTPASPARR